MREFAVVVLSNDSRKLKACLQALERFEPHARVVIVAGQAVFLDPTFARYPMVPQSAERFNFSREANSGFEVAGVDVDVCVVNDDVTLLKPGTISAMAEEAERRGGRCILSPAIVGRVALGSGAGDRAWAAQFKPDPKASERLVQMVPFFATYLPAEVRRELGAMDERFTDYGSEDDDLCYRARLAGIPVVVIPRLAVHHAHEDRAVHTARWGADRFHADGGVNHRHLVEKWGQYPLPEIPYCAQPKTPAPRRPLIDPWREFEVFTVSGSAENYKRLLASIRQFHPELIGSGRLHCYAGWKAEEVAGAGVDFNYVAQLPGPFVVTVENNRALADIWGRHRDAVLVEDDVEILAPRTFDELASFAEAYRGRCIVQPAIEGFRYGNLVLAPSPNRRVFIEPKHYPLICVYFPVQVEFLVGYYDENFTTFGGDDNDYSLRCVGAGVLQLALPWLSVRHHYNRSVFKQKRKQDLRPSHEYFKSKWGHAP